MLRYAVNGQVAIGGARLFRIDDIFSGRTGFDFLNSYVALVPDREIALRIVELLNSSGPPAAPTDDNPAEVQS